MRKACVGITGLDVSDHPMSGLGIAKCLKLCKDIKLIGLTYNPLSAGCYSRDVFDEVHFINNPLQKEHEFLEDIVGLKEKSGLQVIIPSIPWETLIYSEFKNRFKRRGIATLLPKKDNVAGTFDPRVGYFASNTQIRIPPYTLILDRGELPGKLSAFRFPIIIKNTVENCVAYDVTEAQVFTHLLFGHGYNPLCVQEYIIGEEYSIAALANENHELTGIVIVKKLVLTDQGTPWIVVSVHDKELVTFTEQLIRHLNWVGPLELRLIKETSSGTYFLIKFHPCFPSWIYLAPKVGQNLPLKVVKLALGKTTKDSTGYDTGLMYVGNAEDVICDVHTLFTLTTSRRLTYRGKSNYGHL